MIHPHENDLCLHRRTARLPKNICGVLQNPLGYHGYRLSWCIVTVPPDPNILGIQFVWYPRGLVDAMISNHPIASVKVARRGDTSFQIWKTTQNYGVWLLYAVWPWQETIFP